MHAKLKSKKFEDVHALYEMIKVDEDFILLGLLKMKGTKWNDELRWVFNIAPDDRNKEVDMRYYDRKYLSKNEDRCLLELILKSDQAEHLEEINLNVVIRSNGQKRYFSTLMTVLSIFDREDLNAVYQLVMEKYQDEMPEGFDRVLWGDLIVLFNPDDKDEFWSSQLDWIVVSWKLHSSSGIHTLVTHTGLIIHMLVQKKYPLRKEVLMQMLKLKLESEEENTTALELIKFVKKILAELESDRNTSNTNEVVNTDHGVSTASTQVNAANSINIDNLSDAVIYPKWCATTATRGDILLELSELQVIKTTRTKEIRQEGEITIRELRKKLETFQKEKDDIQLNVDKFEHASKSLNKLIKCRIVDNCKKDEFVNKPIVENCKAMSSKEKPKVVRKNDDAPCIEEWVSDDEEEDVSQPKIEKKIFRPSIVKKEFVKSKQQQKTARKTVKQGNPQIDLKDQGVIDSGCSRHMTGNMSYLTDYEEIDGGYVAFGGNPKGGKNLRNMLIDESQVLLRVPRKNNMYSVDLKNIVPKGGLTCLFAKATSDESKLWHRRLGHLNFKTMNKLVKGNLLLVKRESSTEPLDETSGILKSFITGIENLVDHKVKVIRCDNGTEFKNREMNQFCEMKGILRQFSVARTPQQNGVAERRNRTLIEAARTMLADSKLPTTFWAEAVNTACYVQNRVLVVKPHNKTPYELFHGRTPTLSFMRPFGYLVTILNTIDHLGKFDGKADKGSGPDWLFDIDALTRIMNYEPIVAGTQSNGFVDLKSSHNDGSKPSSDDGKKVDEDPRKESECNDQEKEDNVNSTNNVNAAGTNKVNAVGGKTSIELPFDPNMPVLEDDIIFDFSRDDEDDGAVADMNNFDTTIQVSHILTTRIHKDHPLDQVYVFQPPGFEDPDFPDRVYKVEKALYGLHQAPKAWYETLSTYLLDNEFQRGKIDKTLFIKRHKGDIFLVQVYVDDIIFGSTKKELCIAFEKLMHEKFQMSSMGELTFFLGLQVKQKKDGIFISQDKYDEDGEEVDVHMYRSMIGSLMYLTSSRPDIMFAVKAKKSVKLMMEKLFRMELELMLFWSTVVVKTINGEAQLHALVDGKKIIITESSVRRDLQLADEEDEAVHKELGDSLVRAATTASSLKAEHDSEKIKTTQQNEIASLKRRAKKLEKKDRSRTHRLKRLYKVSLTARVESSDTKESLGEDASKQGRIDAIDANEEITLVSVHDVNVSAGEEVFAITIDNITLAQVLEEMKNKGKGILIEPMKPKNKKDLIRLDEESALNLQAKFDEEERLTREKAEKEEANITLIET
ncbi:uncharacterized mitochondrial protein-like protein [Tanacetum coccineum]